jgi:hypothetical protein
MSLNLLKLCVGVDDLSQLADWQTMRLSQLRQAGKPPDLWHRTRQMPRRRDALLDGGSLYWVIKGVIQARQRILDLRSVRGDDGIDRCDIILDPRLVPTRPHPRRAFQGWRYLDGNDAPADIDLSSEGLEEMPNKMRAELLELGLI